MRFPALPSRGPRHRARPRRAPLRALFGSSLAVGLATVVVVSVSGGTLALWSDTAAVGASPVQSGSAGLTITQSFAAASWSNLVAGESVRQPYTVTNTGTIPLALSATAAGAPTGFELRTASGTCPGTALAGTALGASATGLGTIAAGQSRTLCLEVRVTAAAAPGVSAPFTVTLAGLQ